MKLKFLQEGGNMPAQPAPQQQQQDPIIMLAEMAMQAVQNNDGQLALQVCQGFLELVQQMAGQQGGEPAQPQGEPVYRKGGKLAYRQKN